MILSLTTLTHAGEQKLEQKVEQKVIAAIPRTYVCIGTCVH